MRLDNKDCLNLSYYRYYEKEIKEWIEKNINKDSICIDVGANIGYHSLLLSSHCKRVYSFEPRKEYFDILKENIKINNKKNIKAHNLSVGEKNKSNILYMSGGNSGVNTLVKELNPDGLKAKTKTINLDSFIKSEKKIDFIKIDTDGYEPFIVKGMKNIIKSNPNLVIIMEYIPNFNVKKYKEMFDFFKKDYTIYDLDNDRMMKEFNVKDNTNILIMKKK